MSRFLSRLKSIERKRLKSEKNKMKPRTFLISPQPFTVKYKNDLELLKYELKAWFRLFKNDFKERMEYLEKRDELFKEDPPSVNTIYDDVALYVSLREKFPSYIFTDDEIHSLISIILNDAEVNLRTFIKIVYKHVKLVLKEQAKLMKDKLSNNKEADIDDSEHLEIPNVDHLTDEQKQQRKQEILQQLKEMENDPNE